MKVTLVLLVSSLLLSTALAAPTGTVTLPDGVVVKDPQPGYQRGNGGSYGENHPNKVLICHATSAVDNNGYVQISVSQQAAEAHLKHEHLNQGKGKEKRDEAEFRACDSGDQLPS